MSGGIHMGNIKQAGLRRWQVGLGIVVIIGGVLAGCNLTKKDRPPHEILKHADELRKQGALIEAAREYDTLVETYPDSELAPAALYYSGICKYSLSTTCPGKQELEQRKAGLAKQKLEQYEACLDYLDDQKEAFEYADVLDQYLYNGTEFKRVTDEYAASNIADDAAFQLVRTRVMVRQRLNQLTGSILLQLYDEFFQQYSQSPYRQKGIEDLITLLTDNPEMLDGDYAALAETYQDFAARAKDIAALPRLSYLLGKHAVEAGQTGAAATMLGVPAVSGVGVVNTARTRLNIRGGAGTNHAIVAKAEKGEELLILDASNTWYQVYLSDGTTGYAHGKYILPAEPE
jgi:hypothetical protein